MEIKALESWEDKINVAKTCINWAHRRHVKTELEDQQWWAW